MLLAWLMIEHKVPCKQDAHRDYIDRSAEFDIGRIDQHFYPIHEGTRKFCNRPNQRCKSNDIKSRKWGLCRNTNCFGWRLAKCTPFVWGCTRENDPNWGMERRNDPGWKGETIEPYSNGLKLFLSRHLLIIKNRAYTLDLHKDSVASLQNLTKRPKKTARRDSRRDSQKVASSFSLSQDQVISCPVVTLPHPLLTAVIHSSNVWPYGLPCDGNLQKSQEQKAKFDRCEDLRVENCRRWWLAWKVSS